MKFILYFFMFSTLLFAMSGKPTIYQDFHILGMDTGKKATTVVDIENALTKAGISVVGTKDLLGLIKKNSKDFESYHIITYYHKELSHQILETIDYMAMFHPANMVVYKKKDDPYLWVAFISSRTYGKILNLREKELSLANLDRKILSSMLTVSKMPRFFRVGSSQQRKRQTMSLQNMKVAKSSDIKKVEKSIHQQLNSSFKKLGVTIEHVYDIKEKKDYDFYKSYSLNRDKIIQMVSPLYPESGTYTPFSLIVYKKKGSQNVFFLHPDVANIIDSSNIVDENSLKLLNQFQIDINGLLKKIKP